ncbi:MAG: hypothetical protein KGL39_02980 [Patescibacteria group bacterium]|nr:hypothetical protein [Patescibacteria group bacterium]
MKRIATILLPLWLALAGQAQTNVIWGHLTDFGGANLPGVPVTMSSLNPNPILRNGIWISVLPKTTFTDANGFFQFVNVPWGQWEWDVPSSFLVGFVNLSTLGSNNVVTLTTNTYNITITGLSSLNIAAGTNTSFSTNGGVVYINSAGGGSGIPLVSTPSVTVTNVGGTNQLTALTAGSATNAAPGGNILSNNASGVTLGGTFTGVLNGSGTVSNALSASFSSIAGNLTTIQTNNINTNNASQLTSGTVPWPQLPSQVVSNNNSGASAQVIAGTNTFNGSGTFSNNLSVANGLNVAGHNSSVSFVGMTNGVLSPASMIQLNGFGGLNIGFTGLTTADELFGDATYGLTGRGYKGLGGGFEGQNGNMVLRWADNSPGSTNDLVDFYTTNSVASSPLAGTSSNGVDFAQGFSGPGGSLTGLNASQLTNGTVPLGVLPTPPLLTNNETAPIVSYGYPAFQSYTRTNYTGGNTNTYWIWGANLSIPDWTLDWFTNGVFHTRLMQTPEGPLVAGAFSDSSSYPGSNVFSQPVNAINSGNYLGGNGASITGQNVANFAAGNTSASNNWQGTLQSSSVIDFQNQTNTIIMFGQKSLTNHLSAPIPTWNDVFWVHGSTTNSDGDHKPYGFWVANNPLDADVTTILSPELDSGPFANGLALPPSMLTNYWLLDSSCFGLLPGFANYSITPVWFQDSAVFGNLNLRNCYSNVDTIAIGYGNALPVATSISSMFIGPFALSTVSAGSPGVTNVYYSVFAGDGAGFGLSQAGHPVVANVFMWGPWVGQFTTGTNDLALVGAGVDAPVLNGNDQMNLWNVIWASGLKPTSDGASAGNIPCNATVTINSNLVVGGNATISSGTNTIDGTTMWGSAGTTFNIQPAAPASVLNVLGGVQVASGVVAVTFTGSGNNVTNTVGVTQAGGPLMTTNPTTGQVQPTYNLSQETNLPVSGINASGTASSSTALFGDGSWKVPSGSANLINASNLPSLFVTNEPNFDFAVRKADWTTNANFTSGFGALPSVAGGLAEMWISNSATSWITNTLPTNNVWGMGEKTNVTGIACAPQSWTWVQLSWDTNGGFVERDDGPVNTNVLNLANNNGAFLTGLQATNTVNSYIAVNANAGGTNINWGVFPNGRHIYQMTNCAALTNIYPVNGALGGYLCISNGTSTPTNFYLTCAMREVPAAGTGLTTNAIPVPAGGVAMVWVSFDPGMTNVINAH